MPGKEIACLSSVQQRADTKKKWHKKKVEKIMKRGKNYQSNIKNIRSNFHVHKCIFLKEIKL